ncbi:MAG: hypothetical protein E7231_16665 [Cellulosilyticum sp.]|nr:hypothetical protein [Cellulosilyticum sp.]
MEIQVMDLDDYLGQKDVLFATSGYCLDKLRSNRQVRTQRGRKRFEKECADAEREYQERRSKAIEEYNALVESGQVRPLTSIERTIRRANGHPDNPSVQAARRMCAKRGIDWRTGKAS